MEQKVDTNISVSDETCRNIYKALLNAQMYLKQKDAEEAAKKAKEEKGA